MVYRVVSGQLIGGDYGIRSSQPGTDAFSAGFNDPGISFDSRYSDIGTVVASGLITCGAGPIFFPSMPYVPVVRIYPWDGTWLRTVSNCAFPTTGGGTQRTWIREIALANVNSIEVIAYSNPYYDTTSYYNPNGRPYLYFVFASD